MFWFCIVLFIHKSWKAGWWCTLNLQSKLRGHGDGNNMRCFWVRSQKFWTPLRSFVSLQRIQRFFKLTHFFGGREKFCNRMQSCLGEGKHFEREHNISLVKANVLTNEKRENACKKFCKKKFLGGRKNICDKAQSARVPPKCKHFERGRNKKFLGEVKNLAKLKVCWGKAKVLL